MARPKGAENKDKPYREALRLEIAAAGNDLKELRAIARVHLNMCKRGDIQAIGMMADRLDGKPAQEATITHQTRVIELTDAEIAERIADLGGARTPTGTATPPVDKSQLN